MNKLIFILIFIFLNVLFFNKTYAVSSLSEHTHGDIKIDIATDKKSILVMFKTSAASFLSFEHKAKNKKQKKEIQKLKLLWEKSPEKILKISGVDDCEKKDSSLIQNFQGENHSEFEGEITYLCENTLMKRNIAFDFTSMSKKIHQIQIQLLKENGDTLLNKYENKKITIIL